MPNLFDGIIKEDSSSPVENIVIKYLNWQNQRNVPQEIETMKNDPNTMLNFITGTGAGKLLKKIVLKLPDDTRAIKLNNSAEKSLYNAVNEVIPDVTNVAINPETKTIYYLRKNRPWKEFKIDLGAKLGEDRRSIDLKYLPLPMNLSPSFQLDLSYLKNLNNEQISILDTLVHKFPNMQFVKLEGPRISFVPTPNWVGVSITYNTKTGQYVTKSGSTGLEKLSDLKTISTLILQIQKKGLNEKSKTNLMKTVKSLYNNTKTDNFNFTANGLIFNEGPHLNKIKYLDFKTGKFSDITDDKELLQ